MRKVKLHEITDGPAESLPYIPDIYASDELEYRYKLAIYLNSIGACDSCLFIEKHFENEYLETDDPEIPRLMSLYLFPYSFIDNEEFCDYLDHHLLPFTCKYLAHLRDISVYNLDHLLDLLKYYIESRFKSGRLTIDNLIDVASFDMGKSIGIILDLIAEHVLSSNGGDATGILKLKRNMSPSVAASLVRPFIHYGNYDAFKYVAARDDDIYSILSCACISEERFKVIIGYYLREVRGIEDLLIKLHPQILITTWIISNMTDMIRYIIENYQPNLNIVLGNTENPLVVKIIENILENEV